MLTTTDTGLVQRAARGDRAAFDTIYEASFRCVWSFAVRRTADRRAAEALTDRVLARAVRELGLYRGETPFAAWLLAIAQCEAGATGGTPPARRPRRVAARKPAAHAAPSR